MAEGGCEGNIFFIYCFFFLFGAPLIRFDQFVLTQTFDGKMGSIFFLCSAKPGWTQFMCGEPKWKNPSGKTGKHYTVLHVDKNNEICFNFCYKQGHAVLVSSV